MFRFTDKIMKKFNLGAMSDEGEDLETDEDCDHELGKV